MWTTSGWSSELLFLQFSFAAGFLLPPDVSLNIIQSLCNISSRFRWILTLHLSPGIINDDCSLQNMLLCLGADI